MVEKIYNKLVRDNIPDIIEKSERQTCYYTTCNSDAEYFKNLVEKVEEEIREFEKNPCGQEMGDVMEVLDAIIKLKNIDRSLIRDYQQLKLHENGGFDQRIVLKSVKIYDK